METAKLMKVELYEIADLGVGQLKNTEKVSIMALEFILIISSLNLIALLSNAIDSFSNVSIMSNKH